MGKPNSDQNSELEKKSDKQTEIQLPSTWQAIQFRKISNSLFTISLILGTVWFIGLFSTFSSKNFKQPIEKYLMISVSIMLSVSTSLALTTGFAEILIKQDLKEYKKN